jgi:hypothetical protein
MNEFKKQGSLGCIDGNGLLISNIQVPPNIVRDPNLSSPNLPISLLYKMTSTDLNNRAR